jgi:two-component system NtrC family sensor kinase
MTADLRQARDELKSWAATLEQQVAEKTKALQLAQAQVIRSEKLSSLGVLAAGVAHELNSPLTGILTFSHMLLQDAPAGSRQKEDLQLIVDETNRCASIIRQLLDFARESGPQKKVQDIAPAIRNTIALVEHQAKFHDVGIECDLAADLPQVSSDQNQMEQVFLNLLINAAEAMPKGGKVAIRGRRSAVGELVLEVTDTGHGIPPEHLGKIFDPFFTSKEPGTGTGLGLAVTYGILRRHGGTIAVQSTVGKGTTFTITLPAAAAGSDKA